ncbi:MAG: Rrf2 family transcriptional regulator [Fusobacteria bacterium]|nr:Rrf2 family transcriptional regulator [Fusobacteriota bacterium]
MQITTKTRYGLRALIYISKACVTEDYYVRIKEISENEKISVQYLEQILYKLKKNKIIYAKRGPNGGYRLSKPADEISVYDIFSTLESNIKIVSCGNGVQSCVGKDCTTIYLWKKINNSIIEIMKQTSIKELQEKNFDEKGRQC